MINKISAAKLSALVKPGRYGDGGGLWLQVRTRHQRSWLFRYTYGGKQRTMGLGSLDTVTMAQAREKARELRFAVREGQDPIAERAERNGRVPNRGTGTQSVGSKPFREVVALYIAAKGDEWKNPKHRQQWQNTLETYAFPVFGDLPSSEVTTDLVLKVLEPIWKVKTETAARVRGRIEVVLNYATTLGWRAGENPARWRGHLQNLLSAPKKVQAVEHHAAWPWAEMAPLMARLKMEKGTGAQALQFTVLTAARTGEVIGALWSEIDLEAGLWTIPGSRMKGKREHVVPLSKAAIRLLRDVATQHDPQGLYVFPSAKGSPLSNMTMGAVLKRMGHGDITVHGFRSTFRDWIAEKTAYPREVAEAALAHVLRDKTEAAYQRGSMLEKRRVMMEEWAGFCEP